MVVDALFDCDVMFKSTDTFMHTTTIIIKPTNNMHSQNHHPLLVDRA